MVVVTFALQHVHGDIVWQREAIVALGFDVKRDHAVIDVGLIAVVIVVLGEGEAVGHVLGVNSHHVVVVMVVM
ncbi:MAG TPA: hypothetical protein HA276_00160, partial [Candidatus Poseidoniaceae archaeon]|nr:hypothetical protein [Candidatus Poseidoniaceae archaeon]